MRCPLELYIEKDFTMELLQGFPVSSGLLFQLLFWVGFWILDSGF